MPKITFAEFVFILFNRNSKHNFCMGPTFISTWIYFWLLAKYIYFTVLMATISEQL